MNRVILNRELIESALDINIKTVAQFAEYIKNLKKTENGFQNTNRKDNPKLVAV